MENNKKTNKGMLPILTENMGKISNNKDLKRFLTNQFIEKIEYVRGLARVTNNFTDSKFVEGHDYTRERAFYAGFRAFRQSKMKILDDLAYDKEKIESGCPLKGDNLYASLNKRYGSWLDVPGENKDDDYFYYLCAEAFEKAYSPILKNILNHKNAIAKDLNNGKENPKWFDLSYFYTNAGLKNSANMVLDKAKKFDKMAGLFVAYRDSYAYANLLDLKNPIDVEFDINEFNHINEYKEYERDLYNF